MAASLFDSLTIEIILVKKSILILLIFTVQNLNGQTSLVTKERLLQIFKASIKQDSKLKIQTNSNPWIICNDDDFYYKSDTLRFSHYSNDYPDCKCLCYIDWTFYKSDAFVVTKESIAEPRRVSVAKADNWYVIKTFKRGQDLILETYNQSRLVDQFKVISIDPIITLIRIKALL